MPPRPPRCSVPLHQVEGEGAQRALVCVAWPARPSQVPRSRDRLRRERSCVGTRSAMHSCSLRDEERAACAAGQPWAADNLKLSHLAARHGLVSSQLLPRAAATRYAEDASSGSGGAWSTEQERHQPAARLPLAGTSTGRRPTLTWMVTPQKDGLQC